MTKNNNNIFFKLIFCFILSCFFTPISATTFTVINTNDSGIGSFRQAITDANINVGNDFIDFNIPGAAPYSISLLSPLPIITDLVSINGTTQPGFVLVPIIELNGTLAGLGVDGITVSAGTCTIKGLIINSFSGNGILITTNGSNIITGNYIGTDATGTIDLGNTLSGIKVLSVSSNTIGGTIALNRNIISGNNANGIEITTNANSNLITGNYIGTNAAGNTSIGNNLSGISIQNNCNNNIIGGITAGDRSVISGNLNHGIYLLNNCTGTLIGAAYIGTDVSGTIDLGNSQDGIKVELPTLNAIG